MKDMLELIIKNLVDNPNDVSIVEKAEEKAVTYEVSVNKTDMGKVIGKQGKMAKAIRSIIKAIAVKEHKRVNVELNNISEYYQSIRNTPNSTIKDMKNYEFDNQNINYNISHKSNNSPISINKYTRFILYL